MPKKLLVADDSITIQKVVSLTFAGEDVAIESVANGDLVLDKVRDFKPDIVLADVFMPGRNGYEVCAGIKESPELSKIPVVLLVGTFEPFDEEEASRAKCDAYLTKPFDTSELLQVVHSLWGGEAPEKLPHELEEATDFPREGIDVPTEVKVDETAIEKPIEPFAIGEPPPSLRLVSERTRESFLSSTRVLDLFGSDLAIPGCGLAAAPLTAGALDSTPGVAAAMEPEALPAGSALGIELSEEALNAIVERVVRRMSQDVVREVAWEVVPELSEMIIRQCLEEKGKI